MAIFPKRVVQRILNDNASFLSKEHLVNHVHRLNGGDDDPLGAEWEVVTLNAFSKRGRLKHEEQFGSHKKPDLSFYMNGSSLPEFIADVRALSDAGLHEENPVADFRRQLNQRLRSRGIKEGGCHLEIESLDGIPQPGKKLKLALPEKRSIGNVIKSRLTAFIDEVASHPSLARTIVLNDSEIKIKATFDPKARFVFSLHPAYTVAYNDTKNPVANALESKVKQLKNSNFSGPRGVILCDGGCTVMQPGFNAGVSFSLSQLIDRFFRRNRSVSFVLTLTAIEAPRNSRPNVESRIVGTLFTNPGAKTPVSRKSEDILRTIGQYFPKPVRCATTAQSLINKKQLQVGLSYIAGYSMRGLEIKIPSRSLVSLMAGSPPPNWAINKVPTVGEFHPDVTQFFKRNFEQGRTIQSIRVDRDDSYDDDWVVVTFSEPDPALSPYVMPNC
jgi:hypothetical protein